MTATQDHRLTVGALVAASAVVLLSACAGGAGTADGEGGGGSGSGSGSGFAYGASQEEVDAVVADLDPVEITFQAGAMSPDAMSAPNGHHFQEYVEERSGGKISVDVVWGQSIAGYGEIDDALADGRIDVSYALPIYQPAEHPEFDALATATAGMPNSPVLGEMIGNAALVDMAWSSDALLATYEEQGLTPLTPMISTGTYLSACGEAGTSLDDYDGRQVRIASVAHEQQVTELGGSPVSLEYVEVFEALQRGTVDCTITQLPTAEETGLLEVATNLAYTTEENSLSGRSAGANLGGVGYRNLPLAYQQIIFDSHTGGFASSNSVIAEGNARAIDQLMEAGGEIGPMDEDADQRIGETNDELLADVEESEVIGSDVQGRMAEAVEKWRQVADELGYTEEGGFENMHEWFNADDYDFAPFADQVFQETALAHRPS
ncbi:TRAP-type C4-dicarboxylate transport system, substrate-binding protein [Brevibacterium sp. Mu109]|uniref:TRAP transporter substrate-binding protein n=1 Tax=Brevibacterium sp. Mu109 TaxID=1255669 RepID=UPI000C59AE66|nr:C4-dicarboxylate ABC transporter substrate-binding protein [Brevibacterium sp. Mu109]SMX97943.1 TRAP-type C4-dicarboxylate transport system, substrate-binding protein [Brevibacterium sp. Mu109]